MRKSHSGSKELMTIGFSRVMEIMIISIVLRMEEKGKKQYNFS
jgi:hypothetical protein